MRIGHNPPIAVEKADFLGKAGFVRQGRVEARTHVTAGQAAAVSVIGDAEVIDGPYRPSVMQLERQVRRRPMARSEAATSPGVASESPTPERTRSSGCAATYFLRGSAIGGLSDLQVASSTRSFLAHKEHNMAWPIP